jgi:cardiolipin synthase
VPGEEFRVHVGSEAFLQALAADVAVAGESLLVQFSTFEGDDSGEAFGRLLADSADRGLDVRLTVDHYSDVVLSDFHPLLVHRLPEMRQERVRTHALFDRLRAHSVGVRRTAPPGALGRFLLYRDHKKLVILDDRVAYVGGINVSDHNFTWHDLMVRIEGPVVADLAADYRSSWDGPTVPRPTAAPTGTSVVNHDAGRESILHELLAMIAGARETLVIESPYLLGDRLEAAIVAAADRGVQVTLIVPARANRGIVRLWRRRTLQRFHHPNIALLGYQDTGGMLHAKFAIVDGRRATFGSFNMFELESRTQKELNVFSDDASLVAQLEAVVADDRRVSVPMPAPAWTLGRVTYEWCYRFFDAWTRRLLRDPEWVATYC